MTAKKEAAPATPHVKISSRNPEAIARRRIKFVERYLINGNNATDAAKFAGLSPKTAYSSGQRMLSHPQVAEMIGKRSEELLAKVHLSGERWAMEMAAIGHLDPGELYDENDNLIPIRKLPEHVRRAIASVDVEKRREGKGEDAVDVSTTKIKLHDKNTALASIGKHLGMFAEDNHQQRSPIQVLVQLVG